MSHSFDWGKANRRQARWAEKRAAKGNKLKDRRERREALKPTPKQIRYIEALAAELGREPPGYETRDGATAVIKQLQRHQESATRAAATDTARDKGLRLSGTQRET